jgi:tRNA U34 5-carboxymethylaminomethyl modifying enzyme MnmG/GidA
VVIRVVVQVRWFSNDPLVHIEREQMCCYLTRTTAATHKMINDNLHETPTYGGWVEAKGPRYCPSIEDKVLTIICFTFKFIHLFRKKFYFLV